MSCRSCGCRDSTGLGYCKTHLRQNINSEYIQSCLLSLKPLDLIPIDISKFYVKHKGTVKPVNVSEGRIFYISYTGIVYEISNHVYIIGIVYTDIDPWTIHHLYTLTIKAITRAYKDVIHDKTVFDSLA